MLVELEKKDIINMLRGFNPNRTQISKLEKMGFWYYVGGFSDDWHWEWEGSNCWKKNTEEQLYDLYKELTTNKKAE